jgi:hypothetical protein
MFNKLVTVFVGSCTQDKFGIVHVPGYAHLPAILILHLDSFLASISFVPPLLTTFARGKRDTAPVPANNIVTRDKYVASIKLVPRHS